MQILGQMTPETATTEGLSHLWTQASQWADCSQQALLVPQGLCLPTPGRGQISSMEIAISYPGGKSQLTTCPKPALLPLLI